jgi:hypothetical protein
MNARPRTLIGFNLDWLDGEIGGCYGYLRLINVGRERKRRRRGFSRAGKEKGSKIAPSGDSILMISN